MFCTNCGNTVAEGTSFCAHCGQRVAGSEAAVPPAPVTPPGPVDAAPAPVPAADPRPDQPGFAGYAGFWRRLAAYLLDYVIFVAAVFVLFFFLVLAAMVVTGGKEPDEEALGLVGYLVTIPGFWLYFALSESSSWQATLGKKALGIKVTDENGARISFGRATGRYFGKIVSGLLLAAGFIMIAFTDRKQGLHDMMAGCLVVRR